MKKIILMLAILISGIVSAGDYLSVGAGTPLDCSFSNIQDAIDALPNSPATEIRVARDKTYNENLIIDDIDISIIGGYRNCFDMGVVTGGPGNNQSIINGGDNGSVILVQNTTQRRNVSLKNLRLLDGSGTLIGSKTTGGGLLSNQADAKVTLTNLDIRSNQAFYGSGISIFNGDTDMTLLNTRVHSNTAKYAGGIYCQGGASSVVLKDRSGITANITNGSGLFEVYGNGGGAFINGCYFAMYSGSASGTSTESGISGNLAYGSGGGIYAMAGALVRINGHETCNSSGSICHGDDVNPANISSNVAGFWGSSNTEAFGGGIYAIDSRVEISAGLFNNNFSYYRGGGIYILDGELLIERHKKACWDVDRCNFFDGNYAAHGGAIFNSGGNVTISSTYFENNTADEGAAIESLGLFSRFETRVEGSIINNNGNDDTESIIENIGDGDVEFVHTTIADNTASVSIFRSVDEFDNNEIPSLDIHSSIINTFFIPVLSHNTSSYTINVSHTIAGDIASLSNSTTINDAENFAGGSFVDFIPFFGPSLFVDGNNRDYHLAANSQAIDYANTRATVMYQDIDFEDRAWDDYNISENYLWSYFDIGADESYGNDVIFKDNFE